MLRVYIAGKITGDPDYRAKFRRAEAWVEARGHIALNPANAPEGLKKQEYLRLSFAQIDAADVVALLPDAKDSPGAQLEVAYCQYVDKRVLPLQEVLRNG